MVIRYLTQQLPLLLLFMLVANFGLFSHYHYEGEGYVIAEREVLLVAYLFFFIFVTNITAGCE